MDKIVRSVCQACHCECGVLVHLRDGKVTKVKGDPDNPMNRGFVCIKGRAEPQRLYHPDRVKFPLKRVGERGGGKWERLSWDEALDGIAGQLTKIREQYGPESFATIRGTAPRPTMLSTRFLTSALGSPNTISVDSHICLTPSLVAEHWTFGDTITMDRGPDYLNTNCIMIMGGNPLTSHPPRGVEVLEAKRQRNAKLIVVDPYRTQLADHADLWLQIRPGTDLCLILGMIRIIIDEALYDREFVEQWCHGFDRLRERVAEYPLDKVSEITWLPPAQIEAAARIYATTKPAVLHHRVALEHNLNSTQSCRAVAIMVALTGNIDVPGGNLFPMAADYARKSFKLDPEIAAKRIGAKQYPMIAGPEAFAPFVAAPLAHDVLRTGKPYPLKAMFCAGGNPVLNMQNVTSVWQAFKNNLDLLVVADYFMTPTAEIADYVLPAATWLERDEVCSRRYINYLAARQKVVEPLGEAWHDMKISIELVKRIPWADRRHVPWNTVEEFNESLLQGSGISFAELKEKSCTITPMKYEKYKVRGFNTPTGKVELYSTAFEKNGYDPLPFYVEPPESPLSTPELLSEYPFILYTGGKHVEFFHSEGRQIPALRGRVPDPLVEIHPETAGLAQIGDGDWVWIETPQIKGARARFRIRVTDQVHPRMVHARHGWWFPEKPAPEHGCFESNINVVLTDDSPREPVCASVRVRGTLCRIYKEGHHVE